MLGLQCCSGFFLVVASGATFSLRAWASHCGGFSCYCGAQTLGCTGSRAPEDRLSGCGCIRLVAPKHVGCSQVMDWTHVSCTGRWIVYPWATREVPKNFSLFVPICYCNTPLCHLHLQCLSHSLANFSGTLVTLMSRVMWWSNNIWQKRLPLQVWLFEEYFSGS